MSETIVVTNDIMGRNRIGHNLDTLIVAECFYGTVHLRVIFVIPRVVKKFMTISINDFNSSIIILPWNYVKGKKMKRETYFFLPVFFLKWKIVYLPDHTFRKIAGSISSWVPIVTHRDLINRVGCS